MSGESIIGICNLALLRLGGDEIQSLMERSKEARFCRKFYDRSRKTTLRRHPWNFATKVISPTPITNTQPDYDFSFALPADNLRVVRVKVAGKKEDVPFTVREGEILVTNYETPILEYIRDISDPNAFDDQYIDALSHLLASEIAIPLTGKASLQRTEYQMFQLSLSSASNTDAAESSEDLQLNESIVDSRK